MIMGERLRPLSDSAAPRSRRRNPAWAGMPTRAATGEPGIPDRRLLLVLDEPAPEPVDLVVQFLDAVPQPVGQWAAPRTSSTARSVSLTEDSCWTTWSRRSAPSR